MKLGSRAHFEVLLQVNDILVNRHSTFPIVHGIGRIGMNEFPLGDHLLGSHVANRLLRPDIGQKDVRIGEDPDRKSKAATDQPSYNHTKNCCVHDVAPRLVRCGM